MTVNELSQLVVNFGFPIVACGVMGYYVKYITDKNYNEIEKLRDIINNNTLVLQKLYDYIRRYNNEENDSK